MEIDDIRRQVCPLVMGAVPDDPNAPLRLDQSQYLGTGFFVTKNGVAITAAHLVPDPSAMNGAHFVAVVWDGSTPRAHKIVAATVPDGTDISILKVSNYRGPFLPVRFRQIFMGDDVQAVGIPGHSTWTDHDFRTLKGYVTRAKGNRPKVSFAAPRGLSGSPVFQKGHVVGIVSGNYRSEALEDQLEKVEQTAGGITKILRVETKAVVNYGVVELLHPLENSRLEIFGEDTFSEFVNHMNAAPTPNATPSD